MAVRIVPATAGRWDDLADLFGRGVAKIARRGRYSSYRLTFG